MDQAPTKAELRDQLAADAARHIRENGDPELYAKRLSPTEYRRLGIKPRPKPAVESPQQREYRLWLEREQRLHYA